MLYPPVHAKARCERPSDGSLLACVTRWARETPTAPALLSQSATRSYAVLAASALALGRQLRACGVTPAHRAAVLAGGELGLAELLLGVSAVAPCLPLSTRLQSSEIADWLQACEISVLVVEHGLQHHVTSLLGEGARSLLVVERKVDSSLTVRGQARPDPRPALDAALLLPTSGTTGQPKVIPITRRAQIEGARIIASALRLKAEDRCLNLMPLHHVGGQFMALFSSWVAGAAAICVDDAGAPDALVTHAGLGPSWLCAVPAQLTRLAEDARPAARALGLSFIHTGAAPLSAGTQADVEAAFGAEIIQSYGLTETIMIACNPRGSARVGSVGEPQQSVRLLDARGADVDGDGEGEIAVRGPSVFPGYLTHAGYDRQSFVGPWFRTGDLGRLDANGRLAITGRVRELINRGGEKVFPSRVDAVLESHPAVLEASAFPVLHALLGEEVAVAVQLRRGHELSVPELRRHCESRLGAHECPRHVFFVDELPHNRAGKKQRRALTERFGAEISHAPSADQVPGREELLALGKVGARARLEQRLVEHLTALVGRECDATRELADLGLDSVGLSELRVALETWSGSPVPMSLVFAHPTARRLARAVCANLFGDSTAPAPMPPSSVLDRPLSYTEANWLCAGEQTGSGLVGEALRVSGPLQAALVREALGILQRTHPALRVHVQGQGFERRFVEHGTLPIPLRESAIAGADWSAHLEASLMQTSFAPSAPLLEVDLIELVHHPGEHGLALRASHAIWDGGNRFLPELLELCAQLADGRVPEVAPRAPQPCVDIVAAAVRGSRRRVSGVMGLLSASALQKVPRAADIPAMRTRRARRLLSPAQLSAIDARAAGQRSVALATLAASGLRGLRSWMPGTRPLPLTVLWFVDLRGYATAPGLDGHLGPYASTVLRLHRVARDTPLGPLAERCARSFNRALVGGAASQLFAPQSRFFRASLRRPWLLRAHGRVSSLSVSEVRTFETLCQRVGPFVVRDTWGLVTIHGMGPVIVAYLARTPLGAEVFLAYPHPLVAESQAEALIEHIVGDLVSAPSELAQAAAQGLVPALPPHTHGLSSV